MNHKLRAESYELKALSYELRYKLQATSYELWAMSYELWKTSFQLQAKICDMQNPTCAGWWRYGTVRSLDRSRIVRCRIEPYIDRIQLSQLICAGWWLYSTGVVPEDHQPVEAIFLRSLYAGRRLQDFVNSTSNFNLIIKTLKPVLCFSYDGVPLKFKKKTCRLHS